MSMSCIVFSNRHLATVGEWQASLSELGFAIKLHAEGDCPIPALSGHLPATWNDREAGFECSPGNSEETAESIETYAEFDFGGPWTCMMELYYSGYAGLAGSAMAVAAYARATNGVVFEPEGGDVFDADAAVIYARDLECEALDVLATGQA